MGKGVINMIFEPAIGGHLLEYIHNIYIYATKCEHRFIFVLSSKFNDVKDNLVWPSSDNIEIITLSNEESNKCRNTNLIKSSWYFNKCLCHYVKKYHVDNVMLLYLIRSMPLLPFLIPLNTHVSGIIYNIPLYHNNIPFTKKIINKITYYLLAKCKNIKNIFLLNDQWSVDVYNNRYQTKKFVHLTDPIPNIDMSAVRDLRAELSIAKENKIYLQFGSLDERKNTLNILRALLLMSQEELKNKTFIFSGKLSKEIKEEFYRLVNSLKNKVQIIVKEGFVTYEFLNSLCYTSDCILTIYNNVEMSSGTIGYASFFEKPVIGPSKGLLGKLIHENNLGCVIDSNSPADIKTALIRQIEPIESVYKETHTVDNFCKTIFSSIT